MSKLNSRIKIQFQVKQENYSLGLAVTIKSGNSTHDEEMTYIELQAYIRKHGLNSQLNSYDIWKQIIQDFNEKQKDKKKYKKIIHFYEIFEAKMYKKIIEK